MSDTEEDPGGSSTDASIISRSLVDPESFCLIVERHATSVFRYLVSRLGRAVSEDLLADVFENAFEARERYDTRYESALPWLLGIATNLIRRHLRSQARHASMVRRVTQLYGRSGVPSGVESDVAISVERRDEVQRVGRALSALNDSHRQVLVLSAGLGLSYEDIAESLGIRVGTVRSRLSRARQRLRELLEPEGQYPSYDDLALPDSVAGEPST